MSVSTEQKTNSPNKVLSITDIENDVLILEKTLKKPHDYWIYRWEYEVFHVCKLVPDPQESGASSCSISLFSFFTP